MNTTRYLLGRLAWTVVAAWAVLSGLFLAYAFAPDPGQYRRIPGYKSAYRAARNYDEPLLERYLTWMERFVTLDLGHTLRGIWEGRPIVDAMVQTGTVTLVYLVPALVVGVVFGVLVGTLVAGDKDGPYDRLVRGLAYGGFAIPTFVAAEALFLFAVEYVGWYTARWDPAKGLFTARNLGALLFPGLVVAVNVFAVQLRYARAETLERLQSDFVRTFRANGAGPLTVLRHALRNAVVPLTSLFVSELVGVLFVVVVVVEVIFNVPGFGALIIQGIENRDIGLIMSTTMFSVLIVLLGNLAQDVASVWLDPRLGEEH